MRKAPDEAAIDNQLVLVKPNLALYSSGNWLPASIAIPCSVSVGRRSTTQLRAWDAFVRYDLDGTVRLRG